LKLEKEGSITVEELDKKGNPVEKHTVASEYFEFGYSYKTDSLGEFLELGGETEFSLLLDT
jgi:transposase